MDLILSFTNNAVYRAAIDALAGMGATVRRTSDMFFTVAVTVPDEMYPAVNALRGIANIVKDVTVRAACCDLDRPLFRAEAEAGEAYSWDDFTVLEPAALDYMRFPRGLTGKGVKVAVLDTGVMSSHPALRGVVTEKVRITDGSIEDGVGHGTHIAGTIAGQKVDSPLGKWHGIAPDAKVVNINVLDNQANGKLSDLVAGLEAAARARTPLINMSLGTPFDFLVDPLASAIEALVANGFIVVVAAGNSGPMPFTIGLPGSVTAALTVGAASVPIEGYISGRETAEFSSRGPTLRSFYKPDIAAPGGAGGQRQRPQLLYGPSTGFLDPMIDKEVDEWAGLRGSSMATPNVTGMLALLMEKYRFNRWQLDEALSETARRHSTYRDFEQGWGFIDGQALADNLEMKRLYR